jgi:transcriptional regulator with XRE-family HTH domain
MTRATRQREDGVGDLLRQWRMRRRVSQLDVSVETGISTRHLSFVETGRSRPSSDLILRLAEALDVPLRDRDRLLLSGGFAPRYGERSLDDTDLAAARFAVREVLTAAEPYPALAVDRLWNVVDANSAVALLSAGASPAARAEPLNALRLTLHPEGLAPRIRNLAQWRASVLGGLRRSAEARADVEMLALYDELAAYPADPRPAAGGGAVDERGSVHVPLVLEVGDTVLSFLAIISTFGTALDVTLSELAIETFYPADPATRAWLREREPAAR